MLDLGMILTPLNSTNPMYWGLEIPDQFNRIEIPTEFNFFNEWCSKDPENAKAYYGMHLL